MDKNETKLNDRVWKKIGLKLIRTLKLLGTSAPVQTRNRGYALDPTGDFRPPDHKSTQAG